MDGNKHGLLTWNALDAVNKAVTKLADVAAKYLVPDIEFIGASDDLKIALNKYFLGLKSYLKFDETVSPSIAIFDHIPFKIK